MIFTASDLLQTLSSPCESLVAPVVSCGSEFHMAFTKMAENAVDLLISQVLQVFRAVIGISVAIC